MRKGQKHTKFARSLIRKAAIGNRRAAGHKVTPKQLANLRRGTPKDVGESKEKQQCDAKRLEPGGPPRGPSPGRP